jgi:hypothetical protein
MEVGLFGKTGLLALAALLGSLSVFGIKASAAELIMLEQPGCVWCLRWNEEIGMAYPKTEEGQVAPLRRVDITGPWPDDLDHLQKERLTPTFILVRDGLEIARLRGYPGEHFFWPLLGEMLAKLPPEVKSGG